MSAVYSVAPSREADVADELMARGVRLFPVRADKQPSVAGWQEVAASTWDDLSALVAGAQKRRAYGGLGAVTGERHVVLDIDHPQGMALFEGLAFEAGEPLLHADHLVGRTPRGGWHIWYEAPVRSVPNATCLLDAPVDFRGRGGLAVVIGPGRTMSGHLTPPLPQWLARVLIGQGASPSAYDSDRDPTRAAAVAGMIPLTTGRYDVLLDQVRRAPQGNRNGLLYWAAKRVWLSWLCSDERDPADAIRGALVTAAGAAGLDQRESLATVASARDWAMRTATAYGTRTA